MLKNMKNRRKKAKSSPSESNYLPPEIWTHILSLLPAKTILICRCVCKSWCSIIDNPDFVHLHLQLSQINYGNNQLLQIVEGLSNYDHKQWWFTLLHSETLQSTVRIFLQSGLYSYLILGSCNGLLLLLQYDKYHSNEEFILWNPCICKSLLLPTSPLPNSILFSTYLLGYASNSKDYKVVVFSSFENTRGNLQFAVYTLRDQLWTVRNMDITITSTSMFEYFSLLIDVFFRGGAYWLANNDNQGSGLLTHLGSFDFDKERFAFLELPISLDKTSSFKFLFLLGKSLAVFTISKVSTSIWVLEQDNIKRPWTLWFSGKSSRNGYKLFELCYSKKEKVFFFERDGGYFVCTNSTYNIATGKVQVLNKYKSTFSQLERYSESLVLSKGYGVPKHVQQIGWH
ncbi:F-box/kelch-repeat protein At3g06240-like [Silene latifolia]|uniref:F-box/kelch-repeat protein At3g06240-like n=1 Tax=Silene latifolia TaxID=37657 RepID=UPI003D77AE47